MRVATYTRISTDEAHQPYSPAGAGGCSSPPGTASSRPPRAYSLPTLPPGDAWPLALLEGVLRERDGCIFLENSAGRSLLLWPAG